MKFSLFNFSSGEGTSPEDKYHLVIEAAKFADQNGFSSLWVPERHFSAMGCLYPRPQLLLAALARETKQINLRAGSVLLPLHNPIQIAEDWAMLDNLSGGRVGLACATGWHPNDFVFSPNKYQNRHKQMYEDIQILRKLWKGESIWREGGDGKQVKVKTYPTPIQSELPLWVAAGVSPTTFIKAGEIGANLLTHMQIHDPDELGEKIKLYHESLAENGYAPQAHEITVWVQAFVGKNADVAIEQAAAALNDWYKSDAPLMFSGFSFLHKGKKIDITQLSATDFQDYVRFVCDRLVARNMAIFGSPETCCESIQKFQAIGVTEVACQLDFGLQPDLVLQSLPYLKELKDKCNTQQWTEPSPGKIQFSQAVEFSTVEGSTSQKNSHNLQDIRDRCLEELTRAEFYNRYQQLGLEYGSSFQGVEHIWRRDGEVLGRVQLPELLQQESNFDINHPAFIDSCVQVLLAALPVDIDYNQGVLYFAGMRSFHVYHAIAKQVWCHAIVRNESANSIDLDKVEGDVKILDEQGQVLAEVIGLRVRDLEGDMQDERQQNLSDWLYKIQWQLQPRLSISNLQETGHSSSWLIFADSLGVGNRLKVLLEARGDICVTVLPGENYKILETGNYQINPARPEDFQQLFQDLSLLEQIPLRGVVHLWSLEAPPIEETTLDSLETAQQLGCGSVLSLVQALTRASWRNAARLWLVASGSQSVTSEDASRSIAQSPLWGLGKTINYEYPELLCTTVDISSKISSQESQSLFEELWLNERETQIALRGNQRYVARLVQWFAKDTQPKKKSALLNPQATYLITGGLGSLGLLVADWMAKQGAKHLVLIGRSDVSIKAQEILNQLQQAGTQVEICQADVSNQEDVARVLQTIKATMPPLQGIIHAAGVIDDGILEQQNWERLNRAMAPKVKGTWNLHQLTQNLPLDFFVCFSSIASLLGSPGQGNYAAANAFMDALVHHRQALGLPGLSINWGLWKESGMAAHLGSLVQNRIAAQGVETIAPQQGLQILADLLIKDAVQVGVLPINWSKFLQLFPAGSEPSLLFDIAQQQRQPAAVTTQETPAQKQEFLHQLQDAVKSDRHSLLTAYTQKLVAKILGHSTSQLDFQQPLINLGVDSFMSIELKNEIKTHINVDVPVVKFLEDISVATLVTFLDEQLKTSASTSLAVNNGERAEGEL
ncbi:hypothetical protein A6770_37330 [Nostoc minutum NIES-26]|uniref:Uncharacterized protein n=1 Tax=Nostoc minutum NIES-26 TaxID=1844469 RepID=A0A367RWB0_9NOSO|nr:hypothetical protein A6770_37330 [Nostoc minutum NIES-26]